jgi:hypothetical protein
MRGVAALITLAWSTTALADAEPAAAIDKPAAEKLFIEGRAELAAGHADVACSKFEQSILKDPRAVGTLLNLGLCNERLGKVATALARFIEGYDRASEAGQPELRKAAEEHIAELRPQVPFLVIKYQAPAIDGEKLVIDDHVVTRDQREVPIDPGAHSIVLTAPGRLPYETSIVARISTRIPLELPALDKPGHGSSRRTVAKILTYSGAGLTGVAIGLALIARHDYHAQFLGSPPHCGAYPPIDGKPVCDDIGAAGVDNARQLGTTATIVGGIGVVAAVTGITLWLTAPGEPHVVPITSSGGAGLAVVGRF